MIADCQHVRASLAAGEATESGHLARCPGCAGFARDLERLREAAADLPRPPVPEGPRRRAQPSGHRVLFALATAASIAFAVGLVLRDRALTVPPSSGLDARVPAAATEDRLDLLTSLAEARQVYAPSTSRAQGWLSTEIDPLASLQAAALLIQDQTTKSRRKR